MKWLAQSTKSMADRLRQFLGGCDIPGKYTFALRACTDENTQ